MDDRIAVETLSLSEISELFQKTVEKKLPKSKYVIEDKLKKIRKAKLKSYKWIENFEVIKGAKLCFYCEKTPEYDSPLVSIGMTYRTLNGLILITVDTSNGGIPVSGYIQHSSWNKWVRIYTGHFCERFAERILNADTPTYKIGSEGIMFSDMLGPVRVTDTLSENVDEIEFQFKEGQAYGYRDSKNKIIYFRTVYSNDMLKRDRLDFKNEWEQSLDELYKLFKRE